MIVAGFAVLYSESRGLVLATTRLDWILIIGGGITVIASFCWDYRNIMQGGLPNPFNWPLFIVGLAVSSITFLFVLHRNLTRGP